MSLPTVVGGKLKLKGTPLPTKHEKKKKKKRKEPDSVNESEEKDKKKQKVETTQNTQTQQVQNQTNQLNNGTVDDTNSLQSSSTTTTTTTNEDPQAQSKVAPTRRKTEAELNFERVQKERVRITFHFLLSLSCFFVSLYFFVCVFCLCECVQQREKVAKLAMKSHRQRVEEFNQHLASLTEHYDIPKVGPG
jgi:protein FAM32A